MFFWILSFSEGSLKLRCSETNAQVNLCVVIKHYFSWVLTNCERTKVSFGKTMIQVLELLRLAKGTSPDEATLNTLLNFGCCCYTPKLHKNYRGAVTTLSV